jgi:hypothetical protein
MVAIGVGLLWNYSNSVVLAIFGPYSTPLVLAIFSYQVGRHVKTRHFYRLSSSRSNDDNFQESFTLEMIIK